MSETSTGMNNNQNELNTDATVTIESENQDIQQNPYTFTTLEIIFAWISLAAGYLFCRVFPVATSPLGGFIFILLLFAVTVIVIKIKGASFTAIPIIVAISAIISAFSLIFSGNSFLHSLSYMYCVAAYCYFLYAVNGNSLEKGFSDFLIVDFFKALFVLPFYSFEFLFKALFAGKARKGGELFLKILLGIGITIVPTIVVFSLLSYDESFTRLLSDILDFNFLDVFSHIISLGFGIPIGMYLFGLFVSSSDNKCSDIITVNSCREASCRIKVVPIPTVLVAVTPLILVYVIFFISQWQYYVSAFSGVLPEGFIYSDYAREGFFQLCTVSIINLIIIVCVALFMRRCDGRPSALFKVLAILFSVFTLILISTAVAKMVMYIDCYGLTQRRLYATWTMAILAIVFVLIILWQFIPKIKIITASLSVCVILFTVLSLSNADALIARYNIDRYLDNTLNTVDIKAMDDLGDAAIPELVRLAEALDERNGTNIKTVNLKYCKDEVYKELVTKLREYAIRIEYNDESVFSFTIPSQRAKNALKRVSLI